MTAPHVNHALLQRYVGRRVQLVGEVVSIESGVVKMRTSDDKEVVIRTLPSSMQYGRYVCFTGTWSAQGVMDEISHSNWSDDFDLNQWNHLVGLMHGDFKEIFEN